MHITLEADYAIRIAVYLARVNKRVDAGTIAENTGVTLRFALKILRNLVSHEIAKSYKGTQGGYELARAPKEITLKELLEAVEGQYVLSRCLNGTQECTNPKCSDCKAKRVFANITNTVQSMLDEVCLADLM